MAGEKKALKVVQCYGRKKTSIAVARCKEGSGEIRINGTPIGLLQPEGLRYKVFEPFLVLGVSQIGGLSIRVRVKGGGFSSQIYAIRQALSRAVLAFTQRCTFQSHL